MNETATLTLTGFLAARLDEDEAAARANAPVRYVGTNSTDLVRAEPEGRVLREVQAKRAIAAAAASEWPTWCEVGAGCGIGTAAQHLAAVYADHPDYNEKWRP